MVQNSTKKKWFLIFSGIVVILFLGVKLSYDLEKYLDIDLSDEMYYLISGKNNKYIASRVLYPLWYKILHVFTSDTIHLFYLNQKILIILLPACLFVFLYEISSNFILSLLFSCCFLYSNTNVATEYIYHGELVSVLLFKINNFTLCLLCIFSLLILKLSKIGWNTISLLTISFFVLSYCRNEYGVLFVLCALVYIYLYFKKLRQIKHEKVIFISFWLFAVVAIYFYGLSIIINNFSNLHFVYSYSWNYLDRNHLPINITSDFVTPCLNSFGNQSGLLGFFISNPVEFIKNILFNFYTFFIVNSIRITDIFLPQIFFRYKDMSIVNYSIVLTIILSVLILFLKYYYTDLTDIIKGIAEIIMERKIKKTIYVFFSFLDKNPLIAFNALVIFIIVFSNTLFMYDPRYFIHFVPFIFMPVILVLNKLNHKTIVQSGAAAILIALLILRPEFGNYYNQYNLPVEKNVISTISILKVYMKENQKQQLNILTNDGDYGQVINGVTTYNYSILSMKSDMDSLSKFTNLNTVDVFVVNEFKEKKSYLWRDRIKKYLNENQNSFVLKKRAYSKFTNYIYLRKQKKAT